jgi:hypothetical protein
MCKDDNNFVLARLRARDLDDSPVRTSGKWSDLTRLLKSRNHGMRAQGLITQRTGQHLKEKKAVGSIGDGVARQNQEVMASEAL